MLVGGWVWAGANRPLNDRNHTRALGRVFLSGTILVGMIANLSGEWLFAGLLLVLALLTLFAMFEDWLLPR
jgi:hypothetical protein